MGGPRQSEQGCAVGRQLKQVARRDFPADRQFQTVGVRQFLNFSISLEWCLSNDRLWLASAAIQLPAISSTVVLISCSAVLIDTLLQQPQLLSDLALAPLSLLIRHRPIAYWRPSAFLAGRLRQDASTQFLVGGSNSRHWALFHAEAVPFLARDPNSALNHHPEILAFTTKVVALLFMPGSNSTKLVPRRGNRSSPQHRVPVLFHVLQRIRLGLSGYSSSAKGRGRVQNPWPPPGE